MPQTSEQLTFQVHPSVIFKLGEDLITDDYQALSELAKNCYDADASKASISIITNKWYHLEGLAFTEVVTPSAGGLRGMIEVADNGCGMDENDIERGWLTISASKKREMKHNGQTTAKGRTPLGDKGLGRLGTQRLGSILEMTTKTTQGDPICALIDWRRFEGEAALSNIPVPIQRVQHFNLSHGTVLRIYGLENADQWCDLKALQKHFLDIISPYSVSREFSVNLSVDNKPVDLREQSSKILQRALLTYDINYHNHVMDVVGKMSMRYLGDLSRGDSRRDWQRLIEQDSGKRFYNWLLEKKVESLGSFSISFVGKEETFLQAKFSFSIEDIDKIERSENGMPYDPGDFTGRMDYVSRLSSVGNYPDVEDLGEYINAMKGVRVYRDGFGVPVKNIIPFEQQWTSGRSWFTLRPANTIGYINISAEKNAQLVETSNREAFRDDVYSRNLRRLLEEWLDYTARLQTAVRRGYNDFIKETTANEANVSTDARNQELAERAKQTIARAISETSSVRLSDPEFIVASERGKAAIDMLLQRLDTAEISVNDAWELAGLGIAAESVSHEASNIADRIINEAKAIRARNDLHYQDGEISGSAIRIISMCNALVKEVSHLDSSMKYVRNRKDTFSVLAFAKDTAEYARLKLSERNIEIEVRGTDFTVRMNQGRLSQVVDNLIDNSRYWLTEASRLRAVENPRITIEIDGSCVFVFDNGWGIHNSVETSLFDPFVSHKGEGKGRGLGLYISRQLLEAEGCHISLEDERNTFGNRYKFRIDLARVEV
mgnify:FL=1